MAKKLAPLHPGEILWEEPSAHTGAEVIDRKLEIEIQGLPAVPDAPGKIEIKGQHVPGVEMRGLPLQDGKQGIKLPIGPPITFFQLASGSGAWVDTPP